ncbi:hypothetical protein ACLMNJ_15890 [Streptomyces seoulensis]
MLPILERASGLIAGSDFHVGFGPERIAPGNRAWPFEEKPKVVSGIDDESLPASLSRCSISVPRCTARTRTS